MAKKMNSPMVKILLPRGRKNEENFVIVSVNGRNYKIMKGVEVEVPEAVAQVLEKGYTYKGSVVRYATVSVIL